MSDVPNQVDADDGVTPEALRVYRRELNEKARRGEKRTRVVAVRFTEAEYREVERTALEDNYRQLGAWIREQPVKLFVGVVRKRRSAERRERGRWALGEASAPQRPLVGGHVTFPRASRRKSPATRRISGTSMSARGSELQVTAGGDLR